MRKLYFITSTPATSKDGVITGVVANGTGSHATAEEVTALIDLLRSYGASPSLLDSLREGTYPSPVSVYERRADARAEAATLNSWPNSCFKWRVIELGESVRKPVVKPLGWRILFGANPSTFNVCTAASVRVEHAYLFEGDTDANYLFPTRAAGREVMKASEIGTAEGYYLVPVYVNA